jgi:hypothetical protein
MRIAPLLLGLAATIFVPTAALADPTAAESRLIAAFAAVCLRNMGNAAGQAATATAAPWNFSAGHPATVAGLSPYFSGSSRLGIGAATGTCALTGDMESGVTLATLLSALAAAIHTTEGRELAEADSRYWLIAGNGGEEEILAVTVSKETGRNLATLWIQPRAALSNHNQ